MRRFFSKSRRKVIGVILFSMTVLPIPLAIPLLDSEGYEFVRYRNALIADAGREADFNWTPPAVPESFLIEHAAVPSELRSWHGLPTSGDTMNRALVIAHGLSVKPRTGSPLRRSVTAMLAEIDRTGAGYCADYATVFSALAYANGIMNRVWSFSFDGFGGHGHVFNEIWDAENHKWAMIDVFYGFFPLDRRTGEHLSALDFRRRVVVEPATIRLERMSDVAFGFEGDTDAVRYYRAGAPQWYLWWGNAFLSYDQNKFVEAARQFGRLPERIAGILSESMPRVRIMVLGENRAAFENLVRLKRNLFFIAAIEVVLSLLVIWQWVQLRRQRHSENKPETSRAASATVRS